MARRRSSSPNRTLLLIGSLAAAAILLFAGGETWKWLASDSGRWFMLRTFRLGDRAEVTRLVGARIREGLAQAHVPADSVRERVVASGSARVQWRIGLAWDQSPTQAHFAIARALEAAGGRVLSGREGDGGGRLTLQLGVHGRPTHELVLQRATRVVERAATPSQAPKLEGRVALVLYGFDDDDQALLERALQRREPIGLALPAGRRDSDRRLRAAHAAGRELIVQVPMEPENYPRVDPGPGTLLVSMGSRELAAHVRRYLDDGDGVVAVSNLMGSFATQDEPLMRAVYGELRRAGVTFIEIAPGPRSVARPLASQLGIAYDQPDAILDAEARAADDRALEHAWSGVLAAATEHGQQFVWLRATERSLAWLDRALTAGRMRTVSLAPPSRVMRRPGTL